MKCVYDNPSTMAREVWCNGVMVAHMQAAVIELPEEVFRPRFYDLEMGGWNAGNLFGDKSAMKACEQ